MPPCILHRNIPCKYEYTWSVFVMTCLAMYHAAMRAAKIRRQRGLTQSELADMIGVEQPTISRLEKGSDAVTLRLVKQVADALGVTVADLFLDDRSAQEEAIISVYRSLPPERQKGWLDLAMTLLGS